MSTPRTCELTDNRVLDILCEARAKREALDAERGWSLYGTAEDRPYCLDTNDVASESGLSYGRAAGALKRLVAKGAVVNVNTARGHRSSAFASKEEVERAAAVKKQDEIDNLLERYGSADEYRKAVLGHIEKTQQIVERLRNALSKSDMDDVLEMQRIHRALPSADHHTRLYLKIDDGLVSS